MHLGNLLVFYAVVLTEKHQFNLKLLQLLLRISLVSEKMPLLTKKQNN